MKANGKTTRGSKRKVKVAKPTEPTVFSVIDQVGVDAALMCINFKDYSDFLKKVQMVFDDLRKDKTFPLKGVLDKSSHTLSALRTEMHDTSISLRKVAKLTLRLRGNTLEMQKGVGVDV
jgi:hypothetical protein